MLKGFLKDLFWCFHNCCNFKLHFGPTFEILTFNFGAKFAKFPKKVVVFKSPISQHLLIGKFQKWAEMKVNYPTNKENTPLDFSDNFHNIKKFVQVDHFKKRTKSHVFLSLRRYLKTAVGRKKIRIGKNECK